MIKKADAVPSPCTGSELETDIKIDSINCLMQYTAWNWVRRDSSPGRTFTLTKLENQLGQALNLESRMLAQLCAPQTANGRKPLACHSVMPRS